MTLYKKLLFFFISVSFLFTGTLALNAQSGKFTVVVDAGHGGRDPGAIGSTTKEKDVVLSVAKILGDLIAQNHADVEVLYTRKNDTFVALDRRAVIANNAKADLFISLHCNALSRKQRSPQGVETFILGLHRSKDNLDVAKKENSVILLEKDYSKKYAGFNPSEPESYIIFEYMSNQYLKQSLYLASLVQHRLVEKSKRVNRNVRQAGFLVLREVAMPSILVELGYISNRADESYLKSSTGQKSMANSIYDAFKEYKREYDKKNQVFTNNPAKKSSETKNTATTTASGDVEYRVQFLTSSKQYSRDSSVFKGLSPVSSYRDGAVYKYTFGSTTDQNEISGILKQVQSKFKDAFIVEFKDNVRVK